MTNRRDYKDDEERKRGKKALEGLCILRSTDLHLSVGPPSLVRRSFTHLSGFNVNGRHKYEPTYYLGLRN